MSDSQPLSSFAAAGSTSDSAVTPFIELERAKWAQLATELEQPFDAAELMKIKGLGDELNPAEVRDVYLPISRLLSLYIDAAAELHQQTSDFFGDKRTRVPFVIGVAGSVAVGKSTTARLLQELLRRWPSSPNVELVTTDGFLYPNAELEKRGLMLRKGFPESYDRRALLKFVAEVKSGVPEVKAPSYSHLIYDIVPGKEITVRRPDVLIVEGLNVLSPARVRSDGKSGLALSDFFDFSIFVDAKTEYIEHWYINRFRSLQQGAFQDPDSYFHRYAGLSEAEALETATHIWRSINLPNLNQNVLPTRPRATLVLTKSADHSVRRVLLRKT